MTRWVGVFELHCGTIFWTLWPVQLDIKGTFHLPRNPGNSGWDVNGTHVSRRSTGKFPGIRRILKM